MKTRNIVSILAVLFVLVLALTSCDAVSDIINPQPAHEHTWEEATCTSPKTCAECGETEGEALGHTEQTIPGKAATCTAAGFTEGKICTVCFQVTVAQTEIPAKGHTEGEAATCETNQVCTVCNVELAPAKGHSVGPDATCDADQECTVCHKVLVSSLGHVPGLDATCETNQACLVCGTEIVPALGHTPGAEADCENAQTCTVCQTELAPALGHTPGDAATCETHQECTVCYTELAPAKGHNYVSSYKWSDDNTTCTVTAACENDASHVITETGTVSEVVLSVGAEQTAMTFTVEFVGMSLGKQSTTAPVVAFDTANGIATVFAPTVEKKVASHDYVKFSWPSGDETKTFTFYYSEVDVWDGTSVSESLSGSGTEEDPYLIQSAADFAYFAGVLNAVEGAAGVNYKVTTFSGQYFKMTKSIDLKDNILIAGKHSGWNNYQGFFGTFDGNNCSIRGINVQPTTGTSAALFGCIAKGSTLKNLSVYGNTNGTATVGGVVAYQLGTVDNVTSYVTVTATAGTVGGVVANQENSASALSNCVNYGSVTSVSYLVGGIVGSGGATITNCVNWGNVTAGNVSAGGIAGTTKNTGTISDCVNYGNITSTSTQYGQIGGIAGKCVKPVENCVNYGEVSGVQEVGGICGYSEASITDCVNNGAVVIRNCTKTSIDGICPSDVTKTNCTNNGSLAVEHALTHVDAKAPACEAAGNVEHEHCSVCGKNFDADGNVLDSVEIEALVHDYKAVVTAPTCEADGYTTYTCKNGCGSTYTADPVNGGHKDENGDYKCDSCGANLCADHDPAEAVKENVVNETCETAGSYESVVKCSICGLEISRTPVEVAALGHKMDDGVVEGTVKTYTCENDCGKTEVTYLVTVNYLFLDGSVAADADVIEYENDTIYTLNAKTVSGYVPSHDYVKGHILSEGKVINIYYSEVDVWDGTSASQSLSGSGTEEDPFLIQSAADLKYIADTVNALAAKASAFTGKYFKMTKSIDLNDNVLHIGTGRAWATRQIFGGYLDGNNCSIRGINNTLSLFATVEGGWIKNLSLYGKITATENGVGAVAGYLYNATLHNITNYVDVTGTNQVGGFAGNMQQNTGKTSDNLVNYGNITGTGWQVGGIGGCLGGNLSECSNWGTVRANGDSNTGGIAGSGNNNWNAGTITNCNNYGTLYNVKAQIVGNPCVLTCVTCGEYGVLNPTEE